MDLEASLVEKLQELRKWQTDQQQRLFKQQQEQRELLNIEQERMFQALGLSLSHDNSCADDVFSSKEDDNNLSFNDRTPNISNINDRSQNDSSIQENNSAIVSDSIQCDNSHEELAMPLTVPPMSLRISASDASSYIDLPQERGISRKFMNNKSAELSIEGIESFKNENISRRSLAIDDIPVPSPKKDFQTLLEEKLKDSEAHPKNDPGLNTKTPVKRPFLKRGTGLARFQPTNAVESKKVVRSRSRSLGANTKYSEPTNSGRNGKKQNEEPNNRNKPTKPSQKYKGASVIIPRKLNLVNVDEPKKKIRSNSMSARVPNSAMSVPQTNELNKNMKYSDDSRSDLDSSKLETRIFEYMEEKAENSSFCSTSSAVIAFMQQSTPLKLKSIRKHLASQHQLLNSSIDENSAAESLDLSTLKQSQNSPVRQLRKTQSQKDVVSSKWDSGPFPNNEPIKLNSASKVQRGMESTMGQSELVEQHDDAGMSMHVRFAEFNEYKTIGLTDTSAVSMQSESRIKGRGENAWSEDSEGSESSENESEPEPSTANVVDKQPMMAKMDPKISENSDNSENSDDYITEDEMSVLNDSEGTCYDEEDTITALHEQVRKAMLQDTVEEPSSICVDDSQNMIQIDSKKLSDEVNGIVFKSELLKTRLIELEREIEIFRKENAALSTHRQKLNEEYRKMQRELKEKEEHLNQEKIEMEKRLQDEKKRLAREKAAFENRMRDAKEKNFQTKQEREENQLLRKQLDEIMEEFNEKERRWNVAQARQRSQVRVLQMENANLKQEIETLKTAKRGNIKLKKNNVQSNTRAIHQIGKLLHGKASIHPKKKAFDENFEPLDVIHTKSQSSDEIPTNINYNTAIDKSVEKVIVYEPPKNPPAMEEEEVEEKLHVYENILKETQVNHPKKISSEFKKPQTKDTACQVVVENEDLEIVTERILDVPKLHEKELIINNKESKEDIVPPTKSPNVRRSIESKEPKQPPSGSYEEFIREVINPRNNTKPPAAPKDLINNRPTLILAGPANDQKRLLDPPEESPNDKKMYPTTDNVQRVDLQTANYRSEAMIGQMDRLNICPTDSDLIPRREHQKPLPRPPENMTPRPDPVQVSCLSDMLSPGKMMKQQNIREVKHPDGHTEFWYPNGNVKKVYPDRNITKMIYYNGDVRETTAEGCIKYFYAATKTWHTTYPDGFEILEFPDGQEERRTKDGIVEVSFPDGSIRLMQPDGVEKWALPDGTIAETFPNGDKILSLPNGQREIHTTDHKRREYPDGTVKYVYPDGTQETRYSNGRVRMKDKEGNLLIDSHQAQH